MESQENNEARNGQKRLHSFVILSEHFLMISYEFINENIFNQKSRFLSGIKQLKSSLISEENF